MKVLILSKVHTHPTDMGNCWGVLSQARILQQLGCDVDFLYIEERGLNNKDKPKFDSRLEQTKNYWGEHFYYFRIGKVEKLLKNILFKFRQRFCSYHEGTYDRYPFHLTKFVKKVHRQNNYDICIVNYYYLTKLFKTVRFSKMVCFTHDAFSYRNLVVGNSCFWIDSNQEARALQLCTDIFAVQESEREFFHFLAPLSRVFNIFSKYSYRPMPIVGNHTIVFLSGDNAFNQNGLKWFIYEVFPLIKERYADARLVIGGGICKVISNIYNEIDGVKLIGYVENPEELYEMGDVAINPIYQGTGLKIKTFEALSYDKVTMVHPHSLTGVFNKDCAPLFASDKPEDWVIFLDSVWGHIEKIQSIKSQNRKYLSEMNDFIINEYKRFLK